MSEHVILLHGLWRRAFSLVLLRQRLERDGYAVDLFDYASVFHQPESSIDKLHESVAAIRAHDDGGHNVHLVGHSLGGLLALLALRRHPDLIDGKVVCLGSPLRGSAIARSIAAHPWGNLVIGKNLDLLCEGLTDWDMPHAVGAVAGRLPYGPGMLFGVLPVPNDGTVSVDETQIAGLADHCVVAATHAGLLFSEEAAMQTASFLHHRRFVHAE